MNSWRKHLGFGLTIELLFLLVLLFYAKWFSVDVIIKLVIIALISPLVLDLDHKHGKLRESITFIGLFIGITGVLCWLFKILNFEVMMVVGIMIASLSHLTFYYTKHRGFVHSIPFCLMYGYFLYMILLDYQLAVFGLVGCYSHLIADKRPFKML